MRHRLTVMVAMAAALALSAPPASAQPADEAVRQLQRDVEALREGQQQLQKDLQEIKDVIRRATAPAPPEVPKDLALPLTGRAVKGAPTAKVVLVDFTDYQ